MLLSLQTGPITALGSPQPVISDALYKTSVTVIRPPKDAVSQLQHAKGMRYSVSAGRKPQQNAWWPVNFGEPLKPMKAPATMHVYLHSQVGSHV